MPFSAIRSFSPLGLVGIAQAPRSLHAFVMNLCSIRRVLFVLAVALHRVVSFISVGFRSPQSVHEDASCYGDIQRLFQARHGDAHRFETTPCFLPHSHSFAAQQQAERTSDHVARLPLGEPRFRFDVGNGVGSVRVHVQRFDQLQELLERPTSRGQSQRCTARRTHGFFAEHVRASVHEERAIPSQRRSSAQQRADVSWILHAIQSQNASRSDGFPSIEPRHVHFRHRQDAFRAHQAGHAVHGSRRHVHHAIGEVTRTCRDFFVRVLQAKQGAYGSREATCVVGDVQARQMTREFFHWRASHQHRRTQCFAMAALSSQLRHVADVRVACARQAVHVERKWRSKRFLARTCKRTKAGPGACW
mmetsp:Transcript_3217/g.19959  ORF Transcript_3217/g.19959 Transcript_3217/m.19959 type:complete len:361 (+) Transcript_3217:5233-6315(+)